MDNFTFLYPYLVLLLPLPLLVIKFFPRSSINDNALFVPFFTRLTQVSKKRTGVNSLKKIQTRTRFQQLALIVTWILMVIALMRPVKLGSEVTKTLTTRDIMVSIDISQSMEQKDFKSSKSDQVIERLDAVKEIATDFGEKRKGDRLGLIVFGASAYLQIPFTADTDLWSELVQNLYTKTAGPGTAIGDSIGLSVRLFKETDAIYKTLLLITDGNDTQSYLSPIEAAKIANSEGIKIFTIIIGDPSNTTDSDPVDTKALEKIAHLTGGKSYLATNYKQLSTIFTDLDMIAKADVTQKVFRPKKEVYPFFMFAILCIQLLRVSVHLSWRRL
ncbi:MAG: VWA domain-containing protein [Lentisphaeria bacterium]|nr:VWA domain-containing protein [Lentisphaeria bacterium]